MDKRDSGVVAGVNALRCFSKPWHVIDRVLAHLWLGDRFHPSAACDEGIFAECVAGCPGVGPIYDGMDNICVPVPNAFAMGMFL